MNPGTPGRILSRVLIGSHKQSEAFNRKYKSHRLTFFPRKTEGTDQNTTAFKVTSSFEKESSLGDKQSQDTGKLM